MDPLNSRSWTIIVALYSQGGVLQYILHSTMTTSLIFIQTILLNCSNEKVMQQSESSSLAFSPVPTVANPAWAL